MSDQRFEVSGPFPGVLAPAATGVVSFIARNGGDVDRIFGEAGIDAQSIDNPVLALNLKSYCRIFEVAARQTQNDNFGLWFGNQFAPRNLGMLGYLSVCSPTVGSALENLIGFFHYHQQASLMRFAESEGLLKLEYQIRDGRIVERRQDAELSLGMFLNIFRESLGPNWAPEEVHFEHPKPLDWKEHEEAFGAPVYFNQPGNGLLFRREELNGTMPGCDLRLLAIVQTCLSNLGCRERYDESPIDGLRNLVRTKLPNGYPALDTVAEDLSMSVSAVQRLLAREGLTYKDLVESTRRDLAVMYLKQAHLPISEIAFLLGYSELSAFSRAFRRWIGVSPRDYRERRYQA